MTMYTVGTAHNGWCKFLLILRTCSWTLFTSETTKLLSYVPVFRVFVNKQDTTAIAKVISQVFNHINENDKTFDNGSKIEQIMVDFSDAEDAGLRKALGEDFVNRVLRACDFHYKQSVYRVATFVTETTPQQELFLTSQKNPWCNTRRGIRNILCSERWETCCKYSRFPPRKPTRSFCTSA